ncbi:glycosyltransferase family 1 protein [Sphaerospermopsis aphanizomenoides BCCUSP55]|uniref:glycosyltransferase family 1 protein n=1 Tax=Sphaerospermopsis aphanizomenoides TaxID=459663 RepID=UPI001907C537|nr:glycosyltransferase family 1 protein [Sphaerospermopsis aphanizomenoides]MBK1986703.1 glycosyltransferase family 1 protein [Sphaerospermopsis aphanizomenoides BCCUSP55]
MINNLPAKFNGKVYFFCDPREGVDVGDQFQHLLVCLAEGFRELGISCFSNVNYWRESPQEEKYLLNYQPDITPDDCSLVLLTNNWFHINYPLPDNLFKPSRQYLTVYLDGEDSDKTYIQRPEFRQFDFIFRNHFNSKLNYGKNFYPWGFGLSNRILQEVKDSPSYNERNKQILINFRSWKRGHPVRNISSSLFLPEITNLLQIDNSIDNPDNRSTEAYHELQWLQTGKRHYPSYYHRLKNSTACACFGGFFVPAWPNNPGNVMNRIGKQFLSNIGLKSNTIVQWDSWRFWESLAAGCTTFHLDFEKYGLCLPVMPENWRHYIGIDLDNVKVAIERIADEPEILEQIALQGRLWAIENYSPVPTALRLLETIYQQPISQKYQVETLVNI